MEVTTGRPLERGVARPRGAQATRQRARMLALVLGVWLVAFGASWVTLEGARWRSSPLAFDPVTWEVAHAPGKWLYALGAPFRDDPTPEDALARYFALTDRTSEEARALEGAVEAALEGRVDAALRDLRVAGALPLLGAGPSVFPPVDFELTGPPRLLAESPRDRIRLVGSQPLSPDAPVEELLALEQATEDERTSALVVPLGGISTYPAIVSDRGTYRATVETAAHEWVHHYLAFHPLGWFAVTSREALTINETVADIVGDEVAARILARWPAPPSGGSAPGTPSISAAERNEVLRNLRLEVDALLAAGRVEEAEQRMEAVRLDLEARGYAIRKLNQAYFAWYGTYAARPDSTDPLGPQLRALRAQSPSLAAFLERVRGLTTREDVRRALEGATG